jgi:ATP-dependent DNA helicase RecG
MKYFCEINNGFKLAEYDLENRGPGEIYGKKQSGMPNLKVASLTDTSLIKEAKEAAIYYLKKEEKSSAVIC